MFLKYIYDRLTTDDRVERNFAYLIFFICINSFIFIYCNPIFGAKLCTSTSLSLIGLTYIIYKYENKRFLAETCRFLIYALLLLVAITYYDGTNIIQRIFYNKYGNEILWDQKLINWDTHLFGNFWPKGQLSLYLDTNTEYGVNTSFGYLYVEILQLFYISYYGFGHMIALYLLITYYQQFYNPNKIYRRLIYRLILMFCGGQVTPGPPGAAARDARSHEPRPDRWRPASPWRNCYTARSSASSCSREEKIRSRAASDFSRSAHCRSACSLRSARSFWTLASSSPPGLGRFAVPGPTHTCIRPTRADAASVRRCRVP